MDIAAVLTALQDIIDTDETTTKKKAQALAKKAQDQADILREFLTELDTALYDFEGTVTVLDDADGDDREEAYNNLVGSAGDLRDMLVTELPEPQTTATGG